MELNKPVRLCHVILLFSAIIMSPAIQAEENPTPVSVVSAKSGQLREEVPLTGSVSAIRTSQLSPKEDGYIEAVLVDEGDIVSKGDVILELDREVADIEIVRFRAQLEEAIAQVKENERQRDEAAELVKKKHIASTAFEAAAAQVEISKAVVNRLRAELRRQQVIADRHTVYAPFDGVIAQKFIEVGQWVDTGTSLFRLTELNPLRVEVPVPQFYFNRIQLETPVSIRFDALPDETFSARVTRRVPVSDQTARTFPIFIRIENDNHIITPGMSARVTFQLLGLESFASLLLPRDAVVQKPDGSKNVWIVTEQDGVSQAQPVEIKTGKNVRDNVEIRSGNVSVGDRIVVKGNELLQPGQTVNVIEQLDYKL